MTLLRSYHKHLHLALHCWQSNTLWLSCTRCSPDVCTCSLPPGWTLVRTDPRRIRLSYNRSKSQTSKIKRFENVRDRLAQFSSQSWYEPLWDLLQHFHEFSGQAKPSELRGHGQSGDVAVPLLASHRSLRLPHNCKKVPHDLRLRRESQGLF